MNRIRYDKAIFLKGRKNSSFSISSSQGVVIPPYINPLVGRKNKNKKIGGYLDSHLTKIKVNI